MDSISIKRPIVVKAIMTEAFRQQLIAEAEESKTRIDDNLKAVESEATKQMLNVEFSNPQQAMMLRQEIEAEKERLMRMKAELDWRIKEVEGVDIGSEIPFRVLDGEVVLQKGDNFLKKMSSAEVVIKDWEVLEIRNA